MKRFWKRLFPGKTPSSSNSSASPTAEKPAVADEQEQFGVTEVKKQNILDGHTGRYLMKSFIGAGGFGKVVKCVDLNTSQEVAVKILRAEDTLASQREIKMLEAVRVLNSNTKNVAHFFEKFEFRGQTCLAFELLDRSLLQLFVERRCRPLSLPEIRPIAQQLLTAFSALKGIGVVHSDLKPDNIMLVNHPAEPYRVKLIDFGLSFFTSERVRGCSIQPTGYRAPEVTLGLPVNESIDMWGLGCVLVWLYLGNHPFSIHCQYQTLRGIVHVLGQPADHLLSAGYFTEKFFKVNKDLENQKWQLKTPLEYQRDTGERSRGWKLRFNSLDDLPTVNKKKRTSFELEDRKQFVSLLKCLFQTDPQERIAPQEALRHQFISMSHLTDMVSKDLDSSQYVEDSNFAMCVCPLDDLEETLSSNDGTEEHRPSDRPHNKELDTPHSGGSIKDIPNWTDGAAAGAVAVTGSAEADGTVSHGATGPAEEDPPVNPVATSPAEEAPAVNCAPSPAEEEPAVNPVETGPAEEEPAVEHSATGPAEETPSSTPPPSQTEAPPKKPKKSRLKRIRNLFMRAKTSIFGN